MKTTIRKAYISDVADIQKLIAYFAKKDLILAHSLIDLYENIRDYFVATYVPELFRKLGFRNIDRKLLDIKFFL